MYVKPVGLIRRKTGDWWQDDRRNWCAYCGSALSTEKTAKPKHRFTKDHVVPRSSGGDLTIPSCFSCNKAKGNRSSADFLVSKYFLSVRGKRTTEWSLRDLGLVMAMASVHRARKAELDGSRSAAIDSGLSETH